MTDSTCLWCQRMVRLLRDSMAVLIRPRSAFCSITERNSSSAYVLPLILVYGMVNGGFAAVRVLSSLASLPAVERGVIVSTPGLNLVLQLSAAAGGVVVALLLWIIMASVMYVVARLSGGQAGFNKSSVLVGFSTIPLSIYSALLLLLSQVAPTLALTQSQGFGLTFPFKAVFVGWSGLLVAWGTSIAYRIGFKRMLVASLMFSLLFFYGPNIA